MNNKKTCKCDFLMKDGSCAIANVATYMSIPDENFSTIKYIACKYNRNCHYKKLQLANARIEGLETLIANSKFANNIINFCGLKFPIISKLQEENADLKILVEELDNFITNIFVTLGAPKSLIRKHSEIRNILKQRKNQIGGKS